MNSSSYIGFNVSFLRIWLHLSTWLTSNSKSLFNLLSSLNSSNNSCDTIFIVDNGVPKECAAAAACPPSDTNSCSFAITSWILSKASFLNLDSFPKVIAK